MAWSFLGQIFQTKHFYGDYVRMAEKTLYSVQEDFFSTTEGIRGIVAKERYCTVVYCTVPGVLVLAAGLLSYSIIAHSGS